MDQKSESDVTNDSVSTGIALRSFKLLSAFCRRGVIVEELEETITGRDHSHRPRNGAHGDFPRHRSTLGLVTLCPPDSEIYSIRTPRQNDLLHAWRLLKDIYLKISGFSQSHKTALIFFRRNRANKTLLRTDQPCSGVPRPPMARKHTLLPTILRLDYRNLTYVIL